MAPERLAELLPLEEVREGATHLGIGHPARRLIARAGAVDALQVGLYRKPPDLDVQPGLVVEVAALIEPRFKLRPFAG